MKLDAFSTLSNYSDHIRPIWERMPFEHRGQWFTPSNPPRATGNLMLVASFRDAEAVGNRPLVFLEHGAGQAYDGDPRAAGNGSYSGGEGLGQVVLFLCPSERVAHRWRQTYGATRAVAVGCPRLDRWKRGAGPQGEAARVSVQAPFDFAAIPGEHVESSLVPGLRRRPLTSFVEAAAPNETPSGKKSEKSCDFSGGQVHIRPEGLQRPTVAVTFHCDLAVCPETRSAWRHYDATLPALCADPRWRVVGHGHPRLWPTIKRRWEQLGVDHSPDVDEVLGTADLLVVDNSSVAYEAAALGIPVLLLNMPSYRRDIEHGGRFWSAPAGIQCDRPADLLDSVAEALADGPAARRIRARAVEWAYGGPIDGCASERAVAAILEVMHRGDS